jgi:demethylmenaquinone methyltransferase/2-methoxy-6-polyprenyl-1,4-benzoquinol methylase
MVRRVTAVLPSATEKPRYVSAMFGRIARRYDLLNTLMTFGRDAAWRRQVAELVADSVRSTQYSVLDVGTGTGRLLEAVLAAAPCAHAVGVDFALPMLECAPRHLRVAAADALQLPFRDACFNAVISAFVVRNLGELWQGLAEQIRVLRPGGLLVVLETTPGPHGFLRIFYGLYFRYFVPLLGEVIAGDAAAYTYLPESTLTFLEPTRLANLLREQGLRDVRMRRLALGSVALTVGRKRQAQEAAQ